MNKTIKVWLTLTLVCCFSGDWALGDTDEQTLRKDPFIASLLDPEIGPTVAKNLLLCDECSADQLSRVTLALPTLETQSPEVAETVIKALKLSRTRDPQLVETLTLIGPKLTTPIFREDLAQLAAAKGLLTTLVASTVSSEITPPETFAERVGGEVYEIPRVPIRNVALYTAPMQERTRQTQAILNGFNPGQSADSKLIELAEALRLKERAGDTQWREMIEEAIFRIPAPEGMADEFEKKRKSLLGWALFHNLIAPNARNKAAGQEFAKGDYRWIRDAVIEISFNTNNPGIIGEILIGNDADARRALALSLAEGEMGILAAPFKSALWEIYRTSADNTVNLALIRAILRGGIPAELLGPMIRIRAMMRAPEQALVIESLASLDSMTLVRQGIQPNEQILLRLQSGSPDVRRAALELVGRSITKLGARNADFQSQLIRIFQSTEHPDVREGLAAAFSQIPKFQGTAETTWKEMLRSVADAYPAISGLAFSINKSQASLLSAQAKRQRAFTTALPALAQAGTRFIPPAPYSDSEMKQLVEAVVKYADNAELVEGLMKLLDPERIRNDESLMELLEKEARGSRLTPLKARLINEYFPELREKDQPILRAFREGKTALGVALLLPLNLDTVRDAEFFRKLIEFARESKDLSATVAILTKLEGREINQTSELKALTNWMLLTQEDSVRQALLAILVKQRIFSQDILGQLVDALSHTPNESAREAALTVIIENRSRLSVSLTAAVVRAASKTDVADLQRVAVKLVHKQMANLASLRADSLDPNFGSVERRLLYQDAYMTLETALSQIDQKNQVSHPTLAAEAEKVFGELMTKNDAELKNRPIQRTAQAEKEYQRLLEAWGRHRNSLGAYLSSSSCSNLADLRDDVGHEAVQ